MSKRVLIAEDEESIVVSLEYLMGRCGYETRIARDGEAALALVGEFRPHLVLLDIMLPGRSGFEICRAIRADPQWSATRVLMLTAKGGSGDAQRGESAGADVYMTKPFATQDLVARVRALLGDGPPQGAPR